MSNILLRRRELLSPPMIDFTFPNNTQNFSSGSTANNSCTLYGIYAASDARNKSSQTGIKALDMDLSTFFCGTYQSGASASLALAFPFPIYDLSVTIKNVNSSAEVYTNAGSKAAGLKTGVIYASQDSIQSASLSQWTDEVVFYTISSRSECNTASAATTYRSDTYSTKSYGIRSIFINGQTFGHSSWHAYGEVQVTGLVRAIDYSNWIKNYSVPT